MCVSSSCFQETVARRAAESTCPCNGYLMRIDRVTWWKERFVIRMRSCAAKSHSGGDFVSFEAWSQEALAADMLFGKTQNISGSLLNGWTAGFGPNVRDVKPIKAWAPAFRSLNRWINKRLQRSSTKEQLHCPSVFAGRSDWRHDSNLLVICTHPQFRLN